MKATDWRRIIDINLTSTALMCQAMLPLMTGRGWGRIVNIGSASIYAGVPGQAHYVAAKAGMVGLSRSLAREFGAEGVCVNVVAPGVTITDSAKKALPQSIQDDAINARCLKREGRAQDITGAVFFLASPDADFITGQTIIVDGGNEML
jgi:NAD(P)-dependent dehydrogenase (short-subunit alcohol dehydrogenase family)